MRSKKTDAGSAGALSDPTFYKRNCPVEFVDGGRDGDLFIVFKDYSAVRADIADLIPFCGKFTIGDPFFKYLQHRLTLSYPREERDDVNDQKRRREQKVEHLLTYVI